jgi:hypothetical protein
MRSLLTACLALTTMAAAMPQHAKAQEVEEVTIEQIQTVVFPAQGNEAAAAICAGLADGVLSRDGVGVDLARLQRALSLTGDQALVNRYVNSFNTTAQQQSGCNIRITDPQNTDLYQWNY